ncbi:unnamed protein product [Urochloa decumbens]|uniref:Cytochrome P450 n=1 Tax=Urochloa decumbens TaxID=240449 RepID=A0ABC9BU76_9POAL
MQRTSRSSILVSANQRVYVTDRFAAHRLLVSDAAVGGALSDRPPSIVPSAVLSRRRHYNINLAPYGPLWRAIRRNLAAEILHSSRLRRYALARSRALDGLIGHRRPRPAACRRRGPRRREPPRRRVRPARQDVLRRWRRRRRRRAGHGQHPGRPCPVLPRPPRLRHAPRRHRAPLSPPVEEAKGGDGDPLAYVDTLVDLRVPNENGNGSQRGRRRRRLLADGELVGLCSEFLDAGTEPAAAALQWIMAPLVKRPDTQRALREEIDAAVGEVGEEVLGKLEYLNAVIMEGLRLHPTVPMVLRQVMSDDDVVLDGRRLPAGTAVHFPLARLARDETAWAHPREFRPERFMAGGEGEGVSLVVATGSAGEIRMMPFGAGRRMCPGMGAAVLHLGYFVANLVREFEWAEEEGDAVDLQPHHGFFTVMKRPLRARLVRRRPEAKTC